MWVFTKYGFVSCTCAHKRDDKGRDMHVPDKDLIMVRARLRVHLEKLIEAGFLPEDSKIVETENNDYRFRVLVPKADFVEMLMMIAADVDYMNFKSEVMRVDGPSDYEKALHRVWSVMYGVQTAAHGPGIYSAPRTTTGRHYHDADGVAFSDEESDCSVDTLEEDDGHPPADDDTQALPAVSGP